METMHWTRVAQAGTLAALVACGGDDRASAGEAHLAQPAGPVGTGTVTGVVRFLGTAPPNRAIDMREEPQCRAVYHSAPHQLTVVVNRNRTLANVFVYVKQGLPTSAGYPPPPTPVTLAQRGCQYHPRVFGIMVGQELDVRNNDPLQHGIIAKRVAKRTSAIIQPAAAMTGDHIFRVPEIMVPLECALHPWMRAYVGVVAHPCFATTDDEGRFTIEHLPNGTYTIEAWHERYGRRTATVTIADSATRHLTFTYTAPDAQGTS